MEQIDIKIIKENDLQTLNSLIPNPLIIINSQEILFANKEFELLTGYSFNEIKEIDLNQIMTSHYKKLFYLNIAKAINGTNINKNFEFRISTKEGNILWIECQWQKVSHNSTIYILATMINITDRKIAEHNLSSLLNLRDSMLEVTQSIVRTNSIEGIYRLILKNAIKSIKNARLGSIMIKQEDSLKVVSHIGFIEDNINDFEIPINQSFLYKATDGKLDNTSVISDITKIEGFEPIRTSDNDSEYIKSTLTAPIYVNGDFFGIVNIDSTEFNAFDENDIKVMEFIKNNVEIAISNHMLYEEKVYLSQFDSLTNLYNRSYFEKIFYNIKEKSLRYEEKFNLVVFDLNGLKFINDNFGHLAGDMVLEQFAKGCSGIIRKSDILARYGGDEFIGIFFNSNHNLLSKRLDGFLESLEKNPINIEGTNIKCSFSYGIATFGEDGILLNDLTKTADQRMYKFKMDYKMKFPIV
ncbi:diguanylate cyclase (GGDEF)-like protein/PAS domain S-box-containing protein [Acetoanaerobium pronyense]|uniref:Diguanylate cyclase (GGDEF)-like protein/PAS domain S-box-containing protein n=1 Tax=Acetoanaerobium pronyense TaxID=1482736 RepID=A0ABS4KKX7_9FIRM|nr:diguanylate cyclase (GGDEF)-like protein/PAS domain S-box-containing protein [Acetoanaerobium pronyense]